MEEKLIGKTIVKAEIPEQDLNELAGDKLI